MDAVCTICAASWNKMIKWLKIMSHEIVATFLSHKKVQKKYSTHVVASQQNPNFSMFEKCVHDWQIMSKFHVPTEVA
jgi:hypothetical protein